MRALWKRFVRGREGNVAIIAALAAIPMSLLIGAGIDYGMAADRQAQLEGYADAAALSAVTPTMMTESNAQAQTTAENTFSAQASALSQVTYNNANVTATVTTTPSNVRTAVVAYTASYNTFFSSVLGQSTITLTGSSTATGGLPPNIDFYLLLDDLPSMAIAATTAGINTMVANTQGQCDSPPYGGSTCGCAFGCHETNPSGESHYIKTGTGSPLCTASNNYKYCSFSGTGNPSGEDNYALARSLNVTLRIDLLNQAAQNLMATAQSTETGNDASYRAAIYTFDYQVNTLQALTSNLATAETSAANLGMLQVYSNNYLTSTNDNNDTDTDFQTALKAINTTMPNPGSGTNNKGDTPQEILFIVTDGVDDASISKNLTPAAAYGNVCCGGPPYRLQAAINPQNNSGSEILTPDYCATIKGRGIRIAILYTEYLPIPTNGWYNSHVSPFQNNIGPQLQACASPNLYSVVTTNGDISQALQQLFNAAVESAYLVK